MRYKYPSKFLGITTSTNNIIPVSLPMPMAVVPSLFYSSYSIKSFVSNSYAVSAITINSGDYDLQHVNIVVTCATIPTGEKGVVILWPGGTAYLDFIAEM